MVQFGEAKLDRSVSLNINVLRARFASFWLLLRVLAGLSAYWRRAQGAHLVKLEVILHTKVLI